MKQPLISVIVPVYNVEEYIGQCLESIVNQTYKNIEVIVINDGTKDNSSLIAKNYAEKDERIRVFDFKNGGISKARNRGLEIAKGEYIAFVDSDDYLEPTMYEKLIDIALQFRSDIVKCGFNQEITPGVFIKETENNRLYDDPNEIFNLLFNGIQWNVVWNAIYAANIAKEVLYPIKIFNEDFYASGRYLNLARRVYYVEDCLYNYRYNKNGICHGIKKKRYDSYIAVYLLVNDLKKYNYKNKYLDEMAAVDLYHFITEKKELVQVRSVNKDVLNFIKNNISFKRKIILNIKLLIDDIDII